MSSSGIHNTRAQDKKRREGKRENFTEKQLEELERLFAKNQNPDQSIVSKFLSKNKGLTEEQVKLWFAKRRSSEALKNVTPTAKRAKKSNPVALQRRKNTMKDGRRVFTDEQSEKLEKEFEKNPNLDSSHMGKLAHEMGVEIKKVKTWFKNRRYKPKQRSTITSAPSGERTTISNAALNATQETEENNASIAAEETKANAESTAANKENTSPNVSETREEVSENQIQKIDPYLNLKEGLREMQQNIVQYVREIPFDQM